MSSSRKIIKAGNVTIQPFRGKGGEEEFVQALWEEGGGSPSVDGSAGQGRSPEGYSKEAFREYYERGYREGVREEKERSSGREKSVVAALEKMHRQCLELKEQLKGTIEKDVVTLAFALAQKIIAREVSLDRQILVDIVGDILKDIKDKTELVIRVHPDDEKILKEHQFDIPEKEGFLDVAADGSLRPGDVIVETRGRVVDARIIEQIEILRESVTDKNP